MPFKVHLIIICLIVGVIYLTWHFLTYNEQRPEVTVSTISPYSITISHASWGLNCRTRYATAYSDGFAKNAGTEDAFQMDNAFVHVSSFCNGKLRCEIAANDSILGADYFPNCPTKELDIEYRCYSYDRPWRVKTTSGMLVIDCTKDR